MRRLFLLLLLISACGASVDPCEDYQQCRIDVLTDCSTPDSGRNCIALTLGPACNALKEECEEADD